MGNLFGIRRRAPQITAQDRAILQLKQQRDKIRIYHKRTEADMEKTKELALQLFQKGLKERALVILRRKKCLEEILNRTEKQQETLESLVNDIEYTQIEVSVVEGLRVGTEALKQLNSLMNIDDIQQIMEDNAEAAEKQREIDQILQQSSVRFDEEDLLRELESLKEKPAEPAIVEKPKTPEKEPIVSQPKSADKESDNKLIEIDEPELVAGEEALKTKIDELPNVPQSLPEPKEKKRRKEEDQEEEEARQPVLA